eukprot:scaffold169904_cov51-Attheya_sp.AAC.1
MTSVWVQVAAFYLAALVLVCSVNMSQAFVAPLAVSRPSFGVVIPLVGMSSSNDNDSSSSSIESEPEEPPKPAVRCPNCDMCDGSGRILGGIAVVAPWWPIKAFRPCPNFVNSGGTYIRAGQPLDEIAFGRDSTYNRQD